VSTYKQERALENIVENRGNIRRAMIDAGYDETTAKNPKNLTESKGFHVLCEKIGLTDDLLINALVEDIKNKKGNRRSELELAFKIKGKLVQRKWIEEDGPLPIPILVKFIK